MKLLTASLEGKALDWALNHALMLEHGFVPEIAGALGGPSEMYNHTDPAVCLGLIKEHVLSMECAGGAWRVFPHVGFAQCGLTLEQAIARCVVAMLLGDEVDVPDCLIGDLK